MSATKKPSTNFMKEIIRYLTKIKSVWSDTTQDGRLKAEVTAEAVEFLQLRAPSASKADRDAIASALQDGAIFRNSPPQDKENVHRTLLRLGCIIPSIKTLHDIRICCGSEYK